MLFTFGQVKGDARSGRYPEHRNRLKEIEVNGMHVEILLPEGKVKYEGQMITEVQHRIRCAWSVFARHRQELTSQSYLLRHRLHLFVAVVTSTIVRMLLGHVEYNRRTRKKKLRTAQRRMLRLILQTKESTKSKNKEDFGGKDIQNDEMSEDAQEEDSTNDEYDQDSSISFRE